MHALVRPMKPWVIPAHRWKELVTPTLSEDGIFRNIMGELDCSVVVAKPSQNLYLGRPVGGLSASTAAIANIASHGEMAVQSVWTNTPVDRRLIDLFPTQIDVRVADTGKIGSKGGRLLNHFGFRKQVMNLVPESLDDHAWVASALSYSSRSPSSMDRFMFDPQGGSVAGGIAGVTRDGGIFRGSGIADLDGVVVSPQQSLSVSLAANGLDDAAIMDIGECMSEQAFVTHRYYSILAALVSPS